MKTKIFILVMVILILSAGVVNAADPLYRMVNPEYFPGDQDAMIVGQIASEEQEIFVVTVMKILNGSLDSENIYVEKGFTYLSFNEEHAKPQVGDYCILALKKDDELYKVRFPDRVVKANSGDFTTLKCLYEDGFYGATDVPAIQWYVNSGGIENGFGFGSGRANVTRPNGETIDITDIAVMVTFDDSGNMVIVDEGNNIVPNPQTSSSYDFTGIAVFLALTGIVLLIVKRKALGYNYR